MEIAYLLEGLPHDRPLHFSVEFNFAGLPSGADDRYFYGAKRKNLGQLGTQLNLTDSRELHLVDEWLGIDVGLEFSRPSAIWTYPIETVSQSEGGFRVGPPIGVRAAALAYSRRCRRSLERGHAIDARHLRWPNSDMPKRPEKATVADSRLDGLRWRPSASS